MLNKGTLINKERWLHYEEYDYQYTLYAIFTLFGYIGFYFFNPIVLSSEQYENLSIRLISATLAFLLLLRKFWPCFLKPYLRIFWYFTLTFNLPAFFTFMLLQNNYSLDWQLNELMALTILAILTDLTALILLTPIGILIGISLYYFTTSADFIIPQNLGALFTSYITVLIFCSIYSYQKNKFYVKRLDLYNHIDKLNKSLEQKVNERTIELTEALEVKNEFLNNISHEIRTPIQGVSVISEELVENWSKLDEEKRLYYIELVAKNAKRLFSLVANLLDISKYNKQEMVLDLRQTNLKQIIEDIIDECKTLYTYNKNIVFNFTSKEEYNIKVDQEKISQVLRNLVVNAIKYGDIDNSITIDINKEKFSHQHLVKVDALRVTVSDQGVGIPEREIESIFLPFNQSSKTKTKAGGTGLGLAICKKIIEAHKGIIWAKNNPDKGATFSFILPFEQNQENKNLTKKFKKEKRTIMIIDDEEIALSTLDLILTKENYLIMKANSGISGLNIIKENYDKIDLILLDLMMPDMYGVNLLAELKRDKSTQHIPVIIQSGVADERERTKCIQYGAFTFLRKPYNKKDLLVKINESLN